jgi:hypothetical protein
MEGLSRARNQKMICFTVWADEVTFSAVTMRIPLWVKLDSL